MMMMSVLVVLLLSSLLVVPGSSVSCKIDPQNSCKCSYTDSGSTWGIDISSYFTYPAIPTPDQNKYDYYYFCKNTLCPKTKKDTAVACQYNRNQNVDTPLGVFNSSTTWEVTQTEPSSFQFVITYSGGQQGRKTQVTFTYSTATSMTWDKVQEGAGSIYLMKVSGNKVARVSPSGGGEGKESSDISGPIGITIICLAIVALVAYFVVGGVYMYKMKGARGVEMVPHLSFWKDLPFLIKDGFFFTISPCYKRSSYQSL